MPAARETRYPEVVAEGPPRRLGQQIGEAARDQVRGFCEVALDRVNQVARVTPQQAKRIGEQSLAKAAEYAPDLVEELQGLAEAAHVKFDDIMLLQIRNQFPAEDGGCTSIAFDHVQDLGPVVAQNWDNDPELDPFTIVLSRHPEGKPATVNITQAGLIAYIGCNDRGIAACLNTLPAPQRTAGVPHYFTLRRIYECDSLPAAVSAVESADRVIPANILLTTPEGAADLEVTIDEVHVVRGHASSHLCHTNHCLHSDLVAVNNDFPELIQSGPRLARIERQASALEGGVRLADIQRLLSDHDDHPRSICRHQNDDESTGFWQTVFSVIIATEPTKLYATRGTPCDNPYEEYQLLPPR